MKTERDFNINFEDFTGTNLTKFYPNMKVAITKANK